ncbi:AbrB family transcriptional regulator [Pseudomonas abyssi]|uniref:AbrB family transcriptional regulator n=1 Tax=Pseudomonas abyssi TaxID=170540 RepID=UPI003C7E9CFA
MPERLFSALRYLSAPLTGALGGLLASLAGWPLPWMTGSLVAVILLRCSGWQCSPPPGSRQTGQLLVACAIGLHFTTPVFAQIISHLGLILLGACGTFLLSLIGIRLLTSAGYDRATAFFSSMPGGASEMAVIGARHNASIANVVAAHSLRLLMVVLLIPALFTWGLPAVSAPAPLPTDLPTLAWLIPLGVLLAVAMRRLRQPNPWMLGPLIVCASAGVLLDIEIALPPGASAAGQWLIGSALGCHFDRAFFRKAPAFLMRVFSFTVLAMLTAAAAALLLAQLGSVDRISLMLGMMPGGITELCLTAEALQLSVALVTALQVTRLFLVMFLAESVFRVWQRVWPEK